ncbi:MAG TPA: STAS domain-containing protein, partial [Candidatus Obscuribacterales bacterium]
DGVPVLTLMVESLNARNAHWIKDEVLHYLKENHPKGLFLNLNNVKHMGHIGLGTLIAVNNQIRQLKPHAFVCLQPEVKEIVNASHLEKIFQIWTADQDCLICHQPACTHKPALQQRFTEFLSKDYPIDDSKIPHLGEKSEHVAPTQVRKPMDLDEMPDMQSQPVSRVGIIAVSAVLLAVVISGTWYVAAKYYNKGFTRVVPLNTEFSLEKYDKDRDGEIGESDLAMMDSTERNNLTFSPYCQKLKLHCAQAD